MGDIKKGLILREGFPFDSNGADILKGVIKPVEDLGNYIILPGTEHGSYGYPDLHVATERAHEGKNWQQAWEALYLDGAYMLNLRQFVDLLNLLRSGRKVYDGSGKKIDTAKVRAILDDILKDGYPPKAEHFDNEFNKREGNSSATYVTYHKIRSDRSIEEIMEPLQDCLMENRLISLDYWLRNATSQGFPPINCAEGNFFYASPRDKGVVLYNFTNVARFWVDSSGTSLLCDRYPSSSYLSLGVRAVRLK